MAVTISQSPNKYTPSDNPISWSWFSGATVNPNFSYIVEVYIDGALDGSHQIFPELGGGYSHFDASEIVRAVVPVAHVGETSVVNDAENYREVYIKVREFYGSPPAFGADATSATINVFKSKIDEADFDVWNYTDYEPTAITKKFMTDSPAIQSVREGKDFFLSIITDEVANIGAIVEFYDDADSLITSLDYNAPTSEKITQLNLNSDNYVGTLTQPVLDTVEYFLVYYADIGSVPISETKRVNIDRTCDNGAELIWLNKLGSFDVYHFGHNMIQSSDHTAKTYEKQYGGWDDVTYTFDSSNAGVHSYFKTATDKLKLVSKYIAPTVQNWLVNSAYISPLVYIFDTGRQSVNIESTSYTYNQDRFIDSITEIIDLKLPNIRKSSIL